MTEQTANTPRNAVALVAFVATFALGAYIGHSSADTTETAGKAYGTPDTTETAETADTITRDAPTVVGDVTAPWQPGWTADTTETAEHTLRPCETEDSHACHWDADTQGNGYGRSFTTDAHGNVTYLDTLPECEHEERVNRSVPCYWDAHTRGNGTGWPFIAERDGSVTYLRP